MMEISSKLTELKAWDYSIRSFDGSTLEIAAGIETSLYANPSFVLKFSEVYYMDCPTDFSHASIRLATSDEVLPISKKVALDGDGVVFALDAETMGDLSPQTFFIVAEKVDIIERVNQQSSKSETRMIKPLPPQAAAAVESKP